MTMQAPARNDASVEEHWGKSRDDLVHGWIERVSWKGIDPLYVWSAAAGLLVALALIAFDMAMRGGNTP